jgi:hypothetical protein
LRSVEQSAEVKRFSHVLLAHPAPAELTVHVFKYDEQVASSVYVVGAFTHVLSTQADVTVL